MFLDGETVMVVLVALIVAICCLLFVLIMIWRG